MTGVTHFKETGSSKNRLEPTANALGMFENGLEPTAQPSSGEGEWFGSIRKRPGTERAENGDRGQAVGGTVVRGMGTG